MDKKIIIIFLIFFSCGRTEKRMENTVPSEDPRQRAARLAREFILVDGHIDLPMRLDHSYEDISVRTPGGHFDYERAREGGLDVPFMSIYIPASYQATGGAKKYADQLIDQVEELTRKWPDKFRMAASPSDVRENFRVGIISLPLGIENGAAIEDKLENLAHFYKRGVRYITLAHSKWNLICDSSYDKERKWNGLSPFGMEVVKEMNRLGIMVDISHVSDSTFEQVIRLSEAPVIASHSSCRFYTPGFERNMSDEMIKKLAGKEGVILINFGSDFILGDFQQKMDEAWRYVEEHHLPWGSPEMEDYMKNFKEKNSVPVVTVEEVADHIDHVVKLVGIDYVGLGSDFDGVTEVPEGLEDVTMYPNLIYSLIQKGYTDEDIQKICSGNILRVWEEVGKVAEEI